MTQNNPLYSYEVRIPKTLDLLDKSQKENLLSLPPYERMQHLSELLDRSEDNVCRQIANDCNCYRQS